MRREWKDVWRLNQNGQQESASEQPDSSAKFSNYRLKPNEGLSRPPIQFNGRSVSSLCHQAIEHWKQPQTGSMTYDLMVDGRAPVKVHQCYVSSQGPTAASLLRHAARW